MEHKIAIEKEIIVTTQDIVDCVLCCEAGGFDYWGELCSDEKDYEAARERLQAKSTSEIKPCYEDVLAEILEAGGKLIVFDYEEDKYHDLTMEKILSGWKNIWNSRTHLILMNMMPFLLIVFFNMRFSGM